MAARQPGLLEAEGFPELLRTGRWVMAGIETVISLFLLFWFRDRPLGAWLAMGLLLLYNAAVLRIIRDLPINRLPIRMILGLDLMFLANVSYWTGGVDSPFLGQCYLIIFVAALFYDLRGGLAAGIAAAAFSVAFGLSKPSQDNWEVVRDTAPYFVIVGGFTGFLVSRAKMWLQRYQEGIEREREQERTRTERELHQERELREREQEARERARDEEIRRREMELARAVQRSSLPTVAPQVEGLEIAIRSEPSREVGGDFHVFATDPTGTRLGIAVGDVAGKGMAAALVATSIGYSLPHLNPLQAPHAALLRLNDDLTRRLPDSSFATLLYAEIDPLGAALTLWNAGHPPALICRARGGAVLESPAGDAPPLGIFETLNVPARRFDFFPGDALLLCSDGLLEARSESGEIFGSQRVCALVAELLPRGVDAAVDGILAAVREFGRADDDLTIILCQRAIGYPGVL